MKTYKEFCNEEVEPKLSIDFSDETLERLRKYLLDFFFDEIEETDRRETINKCISTYVYCLDKKLKIDAEIIDLLAKTAENTSEEISKFLRIKTEEFYNKDTNIYGQTSG